MGSNPAQTNVHDLSDDDMVKQDYDRDTGDGGIVMGKVDDTNYNGGEGSSRVFDNREGGGGM